jgi:hypothetical protein
LTQMPPSGSMLSTVPATMELVVPAARTTVWSSSTQAFLPMSAAVRRVAARRQELEDAGGDLRRRDRLRRGAGRVDHAALRDADDGDAGDVSAAGRSSPFALAATSEPFHTVVVAAIERVVGEEALDVAALGVAILCECGHGLGSLADLRLDVRGIALGSELLLAVGDLAELRLSALRLGPAAVAFAEPIFARISSSVAVAGRPSCLQRQSRGPLGVTPVGCKLICAATSAMVIGAGPFAPESPHVAHPPSQPPCRMVRCARERSRDRRAPRAPRSTPASASRLASTMPVPSTAGTFTADSSTPSPSSNSHSAIESVDRPLAGPAPAFIGRPHRHVVNRAGDLSGRIDAEREAVDRAVREPFDRPRRLRDDVVEDRDLGVVLDLLGERVDDVAAARADRPSRVRR